MNIENSVCIVTGGASGLGEASVRLFHKKGAKVAVWDLNADRGNSLVSELRNNIIFCKTDITDEGSVSNAVSQTLEEFSSIHIALSCAGVGTPGKVLGKKGPLPIAQFQQVIKINLIGTMNVIRLAGQQMLNNTANSDGEKGVIINTASTAAFEGQIGQAAYSASKAGVVGMTLPVAREFADYGIRVLTIAPGLFLTPLIEVLPDKVKESLTQLMPFPKRLGHPYEFASLALEMVENTMLNGTTVRLDAALRLAAR